MILRRSQSECNGIEDNDNAELPSTHIKKIQNTAKAKTLVSNETAPSIKSTLDGKKIAVYIRKLIYTTG